jgi:drug/metabolite transporter (DMT)-like permease
VNWLLLALATAFLTALSAMLNKKALLYWSEPVMLLTSSGILAVLLFSISGGCTVSRDFFIYLPISIVIHLCASVLNLKALKSGDLSLIFPLINLTPLFMFVTSPLIGKEFPKPITIPGILLIVAGAYMLSMEKGSRDLWAPIKALWYHKGARYMTGVAFFWSLAGNTDKLGVQASSSAFWGASVKTGVALFMLPVVLINSRKSRRKTVSAGMQKKNKKAWLFLLIVPLILTVNIICNMEAYKLTLAINVVSVKRLCSLFSVLLAWLVLGEKNIRQRMGAAAVMVVGVLWVGFAP